MQTYSAYRHESQVGQEEARLSRVLQTLDADLHETSLRIGRIESKRRGRLDDVALQQEVITAMAEENELRMAQERAWMRLTEIEEEQMVIAYFLNSTI